MVSLRSVVSCLLAGAAETLAQVTIYHQIPLGQNKNTAISPTATTLAAYNETRLNPPGAPSTPSGQFMVQLQNDAAHQNGLSIPQPPGFYGFSIEMSVLNQVLGRNSSHIQVPFLNLMSNIQERAGQVLVRLGGNTQEFATMVEDGDKRLAVGQTFGKTESGSTQTTKTPAVLYTRDMFYMAKNVSSMLNVKWFLGIPFNDNVNWRLTIAEEGQQILGDHLLGLQAANEPDFYVQFGRRQAPYGPADYYREVGELLSVMETNPKITNPHMLIAPSISNQNEGWSAQDVFATGLLETYRDSLYAVTVEHYPNNNCEAMYGDASRGIDPQSMIGYYLNHQNVIELCAEYTSPANSAVTINKPFIVFETNSASCGGFPGISDSYTAALWALDYGLQMASQNVSHALLHVGGQNVFYNPFTAPPTNQSSYNEWTVGPVYYSALVMAEAIGQSNTARITDLHINNNSPNVAGYSIYEHDQLSKVALMNYVDDPTGANDLSVSLTVNGGVPSSVRVKYLLGVSVNESENITWAGQTFGKKLTSDGRLRGKLSVTTIDCDTVNNQCRIPVPAPGFALAFLDNGDAQISKAQATQTFATTAYLKKHNTVTYDPAVVATSNGENSGMLRHKLGSTSPGALDDVNGAMGARVGAVSILLVMTGTAALVLCA